MIDVLPLGSVMITDAEGFLISDCHYDKIVAPWRNAVDEIKHLYLQTFGDIIHSLYVRGSVARGTAIENRSDIDTLAIILKNPNDINFDKFMRGKHALEEKFYFSTGIDAGFIEYDKLLGDASNTHQTNRLFHDKFTLKNQSVCIHGNDVITQLPSFKPDTYTAKHFYINLATIFSTFEQKTRDQQDKDNIKFWCVWVMKIIIRMGFIIVMDKEKTFTRDLFPSYTIFAKYFNEKKDDMKMALNFAINPIDDLGVITHFLNVFGRWMYYKVEGTFNLYYSESKI